jgi:hypothetical protein
MRPAISTLAYLHSWRRMRRAAHEALTKTAVQRYHRIQTKEATILISALLANPENRDKHIQRTAASTIMSISYDYPTLTSGQDKAVENIDRNIQRGARAAAGTSLVEFFPWMIYVPQRSTLSPQFQHCICSKEQTGLRSGRGMPSGKLPSVPKCIYDYLIASKLALYVLLSQCVGGILMINFTGERRGPSKFQRFLVRRP